MAGVERLRRGRTALLTAATGLALISPDSANAALSPASPAGADRPGVVRRADHVPQVSIALAASRTEMTPQTESEQLREDFNIFAALLRTQLSPKAYARLYPTLSSTDLNAPDISERFLRSTNRSNEGITRRYGYNLDNSNRGDYGPAGHISGTDLVAEVRTGPDGNVTGMTLRGAVDGNGYVTTVTAYRQGALSPKDVTRITPRLAARPLNPDRVHTALIEESTQSNPGREYYVTQGTTQIKTEVYETGLFQVDTFDIQGSTLQAVPLEKGSLEIPEYIGGRQDRVTRDFRDFHTGMSLEIMDLAKQAEFNNKRITVSDGPHDTKRVTYEVFFEGARDPGKKVGQTNWYEVSTTVPLDRDGVPLPNQSAEVVISAHSNKFGDYEIRFIQDPSNNTSEGQIEVITQRIGEKEAHTARYSADAYDFLYADGVPYKENEPNLQMLDMRKFDGFTSQFNLMLNNARLGVEVEAIPTLEQLTDVAVVPLAYFSKAAKDGDTSWNLVADQIDEKWGGQREVVAAIATEFQKQNGGHPQWLFIGDMFTLANLTEDQKQIVQAAADALTLEAYANGPEKAFAAAVGNTN